MLTSSIIFFDSKIAKVVFPEREGSVILKSYIVSHMGVVLLTFFSLANKRQSVCAADITPIPSIYVKLNTVFPPIVTVRLSDIPVGVSYRVIITPNVT